MPKKLPNVAADGEPASLPRRWERRGLHYWLSPSYTSKRARIETLERVVAYLLDADRQDAMVLAALAADGTAGSGIQRHREASSLRLINGGAS